MDDDNAANDLKGLLTSFVLNIGISSALLIAFSVLRPRNKVVYQPRLKYAVDSKRPVMLSDAAWAWISVAFSLRPENHVEKIGLDATMFLLFVRFCLELFSLLTIIAIPLCLFHYYAPILQGTEQSLNDLPLNPKLTKLGITNVSASSGLFFVHIGLMYAVSIFVYFRVYKYWRLFIDLRRWWFLSDEFLSSLHNRALLVTRVPERLRSEAALTRYLKTTKITRSSCKVVIGRQVISLPDMVEEYEKYIQLLEAALIKYAKKPDGPRPMHKENGYFFGWIGGNQVDTITFASQKLYYLEEQIYLARAKGDDQYDMDHSAFVFFDSIPEAHAAAMKAEPAFYINSIMNPKMKISPVFEDIIWKNVGLSPVILKTRYYIAFLLLCVLTFGWTTIFTGISSLASLDALARINNDLATFIGNNNVLSIFVQHILGPVLQAILNFLLPIFLARIAIIQGVCSGSGVEKSVLYKQFFFSVYQVVILLIFSPICYAIWALFTKGEFVLVQNESFFQFVVRMAAEGFVSKSSYFASYVITNVTGYAIDIIQAAPFIINSFSRRFLFLTPRAEHELNQPPKFDYTRTYGQILLILLIGTSYTVIAPIIMPFLYIYFVVVYLCMKYQLFYVFETRQETGGTWFLKIWNLICLCLLFGQLVFMSVVIVYSSIYQTHMYSVTQAGLSIVLPILTVIFWMIMSRGIVKKARYMDDTMLNAKVEDPSVVESPFSPLKQTSLTKSWSEDSLITEQVHHPALVKPLMKLWLPLDDKNQYRATREFPTTFHPLDHYRPRFSSLHDYLNRTGHYQHVLSTPSMTGSIHMSDGGYPSPMVTIVPNHVRYMTSQSTLNVSPLVMTTVSLQYPHSPSPLRQ